MQILFGMPTMLQFITEETTFPALLVEKLDWRSFSVIEPMRMFESDLSTSIIGTTGGWGANPVGIGIANGGRRRLPIEAVRHWVATQ
jgi:hypothetical protein